MPESGRLLRFGFENFRNFAIFGNVGNLVNIGPFTLMGARVLSLRRAALAGHPLSHLFTKLFISASQLCELKLLGHLDLKLIHSMRDCMALFLFHWRELKN